MPGTRDGPGGTVVFDVIGTLFGLDRLREELRELGAPDHALELWFGQSLRDYFAFSHAGGYVPLREVLQGALPRALRPLGVDVETQRAEAVVGAMSELDLAPGAEEACALLRDADRRLVALSNGSLESTTSLLERAGIRDSFAAVRSCDEIEVSKPAAAAYELAREAADGQLWMVAAHAWDVAGAQRGGLRTAWVSSVEGEYLAAYPSPDVEASDLAEAARRLLAA
jgi:2-haloacid dehalogenase